MLKGSGVQGHASDVNVRELIGYNTRIGDRMIHETQRVYI